MKRILCYGVFVFALMLGATNIASAAIDVKKAREVYLKLAKKFPERKIFYRWQSRTSGLNLLNSGTFSGAIYDYFMNMPFNYYTMHGGRGVYVSESIFSSSRFIRNDAEGALIEVVIEEGTQYIDLEDPVTYQKLRAAGLSGDSRELGEVEPNLIVRYRQEDVNGGMKDWWVIKSPRGVKFQRFNPNRFTISELQKIYENVRGDYKEKESARQVLASRVTDEQRAKLGWKKTYFYKIGELFSKVVDPLAKQRKVTSEDVRLFNELVERATEAANAFSSYDIEKSIIFDHPEWTNEKLTKFLTALFCSKRSFNSWWAERWIRMLTKYRSKFLPVLTASREISSPMIWSLYNSLTTYSRDRVFVQGFKANGPQAILDLITFGVVKSDGTAKDFVDLAETLWNGLGESDYNTLAKPHLDRIVGRFQFSNDQLQVLGKFLPQLAPKVTPESIIAKLDRSNLINSYGRKQSEYFADFFKLNPDGSQLRKLEYEINYRDLVGEIRGTAYRHAKNADQFVDYTGTAFDPGNEIYRKILDNAVLENIATFISFRPSDDQIIALIKKLEFPIQQTALLKRLYDVSYNKDRLQKFLTRIECSAAFQLQK